MQKTTNLNLNKPEASDYYDIGDFNENADILDAAINNKANKTDNSLTTTSKTIVGAINEIDAKLTASDNLEFNFSTDGEGNYGYLGADGSFVPFKKGGVTPSGTLTLYNPTSGTDCTNYATVQTSGLVKPSGTLTLYNSTSGTDCSNYSTVRTSGLVKPSGTRILSYNNTTYDVSDYEYAIPMIESEGISYSNYESIVKSTGTTVTASFTNKPKVILIMIQGASMAGTILYIPNSTKFFRGYVNSSGVWGGSSPKIGTVGETQVFTVASWNNSTNTITMNGSTSSTYSFIFFGLY